MYPVPGFRLGVSSAGIKKSGKKDLVVMELAEGSTIGGSFTKNLFCAAPVKLAKERIYSNKIRYLVTNTGNANAGTGDLGRRHAESICESLAKSMSVNKETVLPFSTGVCLLKKLFQLYHQHYLHYLKMVGIQLQCLYLPLIQGQKELVLS